MNLHINWTDFTPQQWEAMFRRIRRSTLLQSREYALTMMRLHGHKPRRALIIVDGKEAGLVQLLEASALGNILHAVMLDRGPLWFNGFGAPEHCRAFFAAYAKEFPRRLLRRRRVIPEMPETPENNAILKKHGFRDMNTLPYETLWIDLMADETTLHKNLDKNWRGALSKAEKNNVAVEWDDTGKHLDWLLQMYEIDKEDKGYAGPSVALLRALAATFGPAGKMIIGRVLVKDEAVAGILLLLHGVSATYQIGWAGPEGRKVAAKNLLLWRALTHLKEKGIENLDLGGIDAINAPGLTAFKQGMGGAHYRLPGVYI